MRNELRRMSKGYTPCFKGMYVIDFMRRNSQSSLRPTQAALLLFIAYMFEQGVQGIALRRSLQREVWA